MSDVDLIFKVEQKWIDRSLSSLTLSVGDHVYHLCALHGDLTDNSLAPLPDEVIVSFTDAWDRYHVENAKRNVVVSAATMRATSEALVGDRVLAFRLKEPLLSAREAALRAVTGQRPGWNRDKGRCSSLFEAMVLDPWFDEMPKRFMIITDDREECYSASEIGGWWPMPDMSPMPDEFSGWSI